MGESERRLLVLVENWLRLCDCLFFNCNGHLGGLYLIILWKLIRGIQHLCYLFRHHRLKLWLILCYAPDLNRSGLVAMPFGGVERLLSLREYWEVQFHAIYAVWLLQTTGTFVDDGFKSVLVVSLGILHSWRDHRGGYGGIGPIKDLIQLFISLQLLFQRNAIIQRLNIKPIFHDLQFLELPFNCIRNGHISLEDWFVVERFYRW